MSHANTLDNGVVFVCNSDLSGIIGKQTVSIYVSPEDGSFVIQGVEKREFSSSQLDQLVQLIRQTQDAYWKDQRIRELKRRRA